MLSGAQGRGFRETLDATSDNIHSHAGKVAPVSILFLLIYLFTIYDFDKFAILS